MKTQPECSRCTWRPCGGTHCFVQVQAQSCTPAQEGRVRVSDFPIADREIDPLRLQRQQEETLDVERTLAGMIKHSSAGVGGPSHAAQSVINFLQQRI